MQTRTYTIGPSSLTIVFGDLTTSQADVLVSSDNDMLTMGGGVSAAILRAGGEAILLDASKKIPAEVGDVLVTTAGTLPAKHVFHAITIGEGVLDAREIVRRATRKCLNLIDVLGLSSIAFPAIGAGSAGFAYDDVAVEMADVIAEQLRCGSRAIEVTIYLLDRFHTMEPIDFLKFFEEFSFRCRLPPRDSTAGDAVGNPKGDIGRADNPKAAARRELARQLQGLDGDRDRLERRLVDFEERPVGEERERIGRQLSQIQATRLDLLSRLSARSTERLSVFISYAHQDEELRRELGKHLSALERYGLIDTWHDRKIAAGSERDGAIAEQLESACVFLLLISADFMASDYCYDIEMKRALERHDRREALRAPNLKYMSSLVETLVAQGGGLTFLGHHDATSHF